MELGLRQVTNSVRPIKTMADLKGLKIRMQPIETHLATFRALGANPQPMDITEVYSALEQKVIDGQENPYYADPAPAASTRCRSTSRNTGHFFDFIAVVANKKKFEALTPEIPEGHPHGDGQGAIACAAQSLPPRPMPTRWRELQKKGMPTPRCRRPSARP